MFFPFRRKIAPFDSLNFSEVVLAFYWILGACFGVCLSVASSDYLDSLMPLLLSSNVSIMGRLMLLIFPFILTVIVVLFSLHRLLCAIAFGKAFCLFFTIGSVYYYFGSAGWLVHILFLFSDSVSAVLLFWSMLHCTSRTGVVQWHVIFVCVFLLILALIADFYFLTPFLFSLFI